jgi:hypothetical protein
MLTLESFPFVYFIFLHQKLKAATIDHIPDALRISKRRDREPLPPAHVVKDSFSKGKTALFLPLS